MSDLVVSIRLLRGWKVISLNPFYAELMYLISYPLEIVFRNRNPQLQVGKKSSYLFYSRLFKHFIPILLLFNWPIQRIKKSYNRA